MSGGDIALELHADARRPAADQIVGPVARVRAPADQRGQAARSAPSPSPRCPSTWSASVVPGPPAATGGVRSGCRSRPGVEASVGAGRGGASGTGRSSGSGSALLAPRRRGVSTLAAGADRGGDRDDGATVTATAVAAHSRDPACLASSCRRRFAPGLSHANADTRFARGRASRLGAQGTSMPCRTSWSSRTIPRCARRCCGPWASGSTPRAPAATGMAGLEAAVQDRPDLVVIDLGLPDVDGHEVLRMLRAVSTVPVIVATAREDEAEIVRALDAGADDYLVKPFGPASSTRGSGPCCAAPPATRRATPRHGRRAGGRPAPPGPPGSTARAGPDPARVRPAALPRPAGRPGGHQAGAAGRGVAPALRRGRQDRRRAPVLATPQAGRDRPAAAVPAHRPRRGVRLDAPRPAEAPGRAAYGSHLLVAATTSLVLLAFLVPLALLLRSAAEERAIRGRPTGPSRSPRWCPLGTSRHAAPARPAGRSPSSWPTAGAPARPRPVRPSVELARRGRAFTATHAGGVEVLVPVRAWPAVPRWCGRSSRTRRCTRVWPRTWSVWPL